LQLKAGSSRPRPSWAISFSRQRAEEAQPRTVGVLLRHGAASAWSEVIEQGLAAGGMGPSG